MFDGSELSETNLRSIALFLGPGEAEIQALHNGKETRLYSAFYLSCDEEFHVYSPRAFRTAEFETSGDKTRCTDSEVVNYLNRSPESAAYIDRNFGNAESRAGFGEPEVMEIGYADLPETVRGQL